MHPAFKFRLNRWEPLVTVPAFALMIRADRVLPLPGLVLLDVQVTRCPEHLAPRSGSPSLAVELIALLWIAILMVVVISHP